MYGIRWIVSSMLCPIFPRKQQAKFNKPKRRTRIGSYHNEDHDAPYRHFFITAYIWENVCRGNKKTVFTCTESEYLKYAVMQNLPCSVFLVSVLSSVSPGLMFDFRLSSHMPRFMVLEGLQANPSSIRHLRNEHLQEMGQQAVREFAWTNLQRLHGVAGIWCILLPQRWSMWVNSTTVNVLILCGKNEPLHAPRTLFSVGVERTNRYTLHGLYFP